MASNLPIPRPPRTPTPPPDDPTSVTDGQPLRGFAATYDKDTLSPMADHFSQNGLNVEDGDRLSPTRSSFKLSPTDVSVQSGASDNGSAGPFNFQTTTMAKGPVMKSVSISLNTVYGPLSLYWNANCLARNSCRTLASGVDTSINIVVYRIKYSSNLLPELLWLFRIRYLFPRSKNAVLVCRRIRRRGSGGVSAICSLPHTRSGAHMDPWL